MSRTRVIQQYIVKDRIVTDLTGLDIPAGAKVVREYNPAYIDDDIRLEREVEQTDQDYAIERRAALDKAAKLRDQAVEAAFVAYEEVMQEWPR